MTIQQDFERIARAVGPMETPPLDVLGLAMQWANSPEQGGQGYHVIIQTDVGDELEGAIHHSTTDDILVLVPVEDDGTSRRYIRRATIDSVEVQF